MKTKISFLSQTYRNMMSGYFALMLAIVVNVILVPTILSNLGKELYGLWFLIFNIISYFYLADFGITNAITRLYSKYSVAGQDKINKLLSSAYIIVLALDVMLILLVLFFEAKIIDYLEIDSHNLEVFALLFLIAVFELFSQFILRVNFGIIRGEHKYNIAYNLESLTAILRILSLIFLVYTDSFTVLNFALLYSLSKIFSDSLSFFFLRNIFKNLTFKLDFYVLKELIDNSGSTLITSISATVYNSLPLLLFGKIFGVERVFLYSIPFAIMIMISRLMNVMYAGFTPRAAELKAMNDDDEINKISNYAVKISLLFGSLSLIFFIIFGFEIFEIWLGSSGVLTVTDLRIIYNIFILLLIYLTIANFQNANIVIYQAAGLHWYVTFETVISAVVLLVLSYIFVEKLEVYAFAAAMICVGGFKYIYYQYSATTKIKTYSLSWFILLMLVTYICAIYFTNILLTSILDKFIFCLIGCLSFIACVYLYLFDEYEKHEIQVQLDKLKW
ncbi:hypothetical protein N8291_06515 [Pseudomonadales bacterium]|nr:hypothetical protein [Pseudomonadales bacterium]